MSVVGAIGLALSLGGQAISYSAQQKMIAEQTNASKKAENSREQQMRMDANHRRRQAVREGVVARSNSLAVGVSQGAQYSSGIAGAMGNATSQGLQNQQIASASEVMGGRVFAANREYFNASQRGQAGMAMGQGLSSLGGAIVNNADEINSMGQYFGQRPAGSTLNRNV